MFRSCARTATYPTSQQPNTVDIHFPLCKWETHTLVSCPKPKSSPIRTWCPIPVTTPSATRRCDVQWEHGESRLRLAGQPTFSILCDADSGESGREGAPDPPYNAESQSFSKALCAGKGHHRKCSQPSDPCQTAQEPKRSTEHWATQIEAFGLSCQNGNGVIPNQSRVSVLHLKSFNCI